MSQGRFLTCWGVFVVVMMFRKAIQATVLHFSCQGDEVDPFYSVDPQALDEIALKSLDFGTN